MKKNNIRLILLTSLLLSGCKTTTTNPEQPALQTYSNSTLDSGFDTIILLSETTDDKEAFDRHFETVCEKFLYYNNLYDIYNDYEGMNNLKTVNDNAGIAPVEVDEELINLLKLAKEFYTLSNGEFDVTMGSVLRVWHEYREAGIDLNIDGKLAPIPDEVTLLNASEHIGWENVEIDETAHTVFISDPEASIDVGGIAKGYATEMVARELENSGVTHATLNAGGNNRTLGEKIDGSAWRVGIQNPDDAGSLLVVNIHGSMSFVTSGDYERFYYGVDGERYSHIIDPATLYPAVQFRSVSIITDDSAAADCLSTTLFTMSYEDGLKLIDDYRNSHPDNTLEVIWIMDQDKAIKADNSVLLNNLYVIYTSGLKDSLKW